MAPSEKPIVVIGGGGHGMVVIDALWTAGRFVLGVIDPKVPEGLPANVSYLGAGLDLVRPEEVDLALGLGSVDVDGAIRRLRLFEEGLRAGFQWATVRHASAIVARDVQLGHGVQLMAGCVVQPRTRIGDNVIINTRASIDHDCIIGAHSHLAPGVTLSGGVTVGAGCHLGTGATVIQSIVVGEATLVVAGATVTRNVAPHSRVRRHAVE